MEEKEFSRIDEIISKSLSEGGSVDSLPLEIITLIAQQLTGPVDLIRLSEVSKTYYQLANDDRLWQHFGYKNKQEYKDLYLQSNLKGTDFMGVMISRSLKPDDSSAKNAFQRHLKNREPFKSSTSTGVDFIVVKSGDHTIRMWDTASSPRFKDATKNVVRRADIVLAFPKDFNDAKQLLSMVNKHTIEKPQQVFLMIETNMLDPTDFEELTDRWVHVIPYQQNSATISPPIEDILKDIISIATKAPAAQPEPPSPSKQP